MYKQLVVGTDGSAGASVALDAAVELARLTGATLHIVTAYHLANGYQSATAAQVGIPAVDVVTPDDAAHAEARRICDQGVERAGRVGVSTETHCVAGEAADALIRVAEDTSADLVVVGNRGMAGFRRFVLGSVPNRLSHHCPSSLLIVDTTPART
jgi:nucleotide-binding universal stress UspA family protein